jgi:DNA-binding XRE family transcriptional regulator
MDNLQLKMARAALGLGVHKLAEVTGVSHFTIQRIEAGEPVKPNTIAKVRSALEALGIIFIAENGEGPGVRLRKSRPNEGKRPEQLTTENEG